MDESTETPYTVIKLDVPRRVRWDINAICEFEEMTGKSIWTALQTYSLREARLLLYVGLRAMDPNQKDRFLRTLTLPRVGLLMNEAGDITALMAEVLKAVMKDLGLGDAAGAQGEAKVSSAGQKSSGEDTMSLASPGETPENSP